MSKWFLRGLVFAALMVVIRLIQGVLINAFEAQAGLISLVLVTLFAIGVFIWGRSDGRADATAHADPDRRDDLAMTWLGAGLVAGLLSGFVAWVIGQFDKALYISTFFNELTSFASFTALLVFVVGVAAVAIGRRSADKEFEKHPERRPSPVVVADVESQPTTDVFATVGAPAVVEDETGAVQAAADAGATLAAPAAGFTTEEIPAEEDTADATTEIPVIQDAGETVDLAAQSEDVVAEDAAPDVESSDDSTK